MSDSKSIIQRVVRTQLVALVLSAALSTSAAAAWAQGIDDKVHDPTRQPDAVVAQSPGQPAETAATPSLFQQGVEFGVGLGWYDNDLGHSDGQFVRYRLSRPYNFGLGVDVGRQYRFGETSYGYGLSFSKSLPADIGVTVGFSSGTGEVLAPRYRYDLSVSMPLAEWIVTGGYTRVQSKIENASDGYSLGVMRYFPQWIVGGHVRNDIGFPGRTHSPSAGFGATWYRWKDLYIGAGLNWGRASYLLLPDRAEVNYDGFSGNVGVSRWLTDASGFNVRFDYGGTDFYRSGGITVSVFREF